MKNTEYQNKIFYDKRWQEDEKKFKSITDNRILCSCGHSILTTKPKQICDWCGHYVYRDKKLEFEEKLKKRLKKGE